MDEYRVPETDHYDVAFEVLGAYHLIEWFRFTLFLIAVTLGANLIIIYYALYLNTLFGLAAYIIVHVKRFGEDGKICADYQVYRAEVLMAEVIIFWITFFVMSFPQIILFFMKKESIEDAYQGPKEEEEGEGEGEGGDEKKWDTPILNKQDYILISDFYA